MCHILRLVFSIPQILPAQAYAFTAHIDLTSSKLNSERVKEIAKEFGDRAAVDDFDTNKKENILKYRSLGAIIVNNKYLGAGPTLNEEDIQKVFQERMKTA